MKSLFILKPDMLEDEEAMTAFYTRLSEEEITVLEEYSIKDWVELSKALYQGEAVSDEKKKKFLTSIKGYDYLYRDKNATLVVVDVKEENLERVKDVKFSIRRDFVYDSTPERYIRFEEEVDLSQDLTKIDVSNLRISYHKLEEMEDKAKLVREGYSMCFINKVHSPDATKEAVERDFRVLEESGVMTEENRIRR